MLENVGSNTFIEEARYPLQNDGIIIGDSIGHRLQKQIDFIGSETPCKQKMLLQMRFYEGKSSWLCTMIGLAQAKRAFCCGPGGRLNIASNAPYSWASSFLRSCERSRRWCASQAR